MPKRIQRKRTKGWRMPPNTVYVGRPTIYGNPWYGDWPPGVCVANYRKWLTGCYSMGGIGKASIIIGHLPELRGKDLACWCPLDRECHADILLELANKEGGD